MHMYSSFIRTSVSFSIYIYICVYINVCSHVYVCMLSTNACAAAAAAFASDMYALSSHSSAPYAGAETWIQSECLHRPISLV